MMATPEDKASPFRSVEDSRETDNGDSKDPEENIDSDDDECLTDMGFMFEAEQPSREQHFDFGRGIQVQVSVADDDPGAVQSGHYLWPAAELLAQYLVDSTTTTIKSVASHAAESNTEITSQSPVVASDPHVVTKVVELGAGCAVASLVALQVWPSLKQVTVTDYDPGTLERARENYAMTCELQLSKKQGVDDQVTSAPKVDFEVLEWGDAAGVQRIRNLAEASSRGLGNDMDDGSYDVVLGSDLIYCQEVVAPLLRTAAQLLSSKGRFLLSQSFAYDAATEDLIDELCESLAWQRATLLDEKKEEHASNNSTRAGQRCYRVQEFRRRND